MSGRASAPRRTAAHDRYESVGTPRAPTGTPRAPSEDRGARGVPRSSGLPLRPGRTGGAPGAHPLWAASRLPRNARCLIPKLVARIDRPWCGTSSDLSEAVQLGRGLCTVPAAMAAGESVLAELGWSVTRIEDLWFIVPP